MKFLTTTWAALFLLSGNSYASAYIECTGVVTLTHIEEVLKNELVPTALVDMKVNAKYFKCDGHGIAMPVGHLKRVRIELNSVVPKPHTYYLVSFAGGNGTLLFLDDFSFDTRSYTSWKFIKKVRSFSARPKNKPAHTNASGSFTNEYIPQYPYVPKTGVDLYTVEKLWKVKTGVNK